MYQCVRVAHFITSFTHSRNICTYHLFWEKLLYSLQNTRYRSLNSSSFNSKAQCFDFLLEFSIFDSASLCFYFHYQQPSNQDIHAKIAANVFQIPTKNNRTKKMRKEQKLVIGPQQSCEWLCDWRENLKFHNSQRIENCRSRQTQMIIMSIQLLSNCVFFLLYRCYLTRHHRFGVCGKYFTVTEFSMCVCHKNGVRFRWIMP